MGVNTRYPLDTLRFVEFESDSEEAPADCFEAAATWLREQECGVVGVGVVYSEGHYTLQVAATFGFDDADGDTS